MGGLFYQSEAYHIVDYDLWRLEGCDEYFRGPQMVCNPGKYVAYVGAAQTFGTFCRFPFVSLVTERVGGAAANFGIGGAGPRRFFGDEALMRAINSAGVVVVQVMSGRSVGNSLYENLDGTSSLRLRSKPGSNWVWAESVWDELVKTKPREDVLRLVEETRANWVAEMRTLLQAIKPPKILVWFSTRRPSHNFTYENAQTLLGPFPHFVNADMLGDIMHLTDDYVEAVSSQGLPQPLYDRFTGERTSVTRPDYARVTMNGGYPSPQMHVAAAEALAPTLVKLLKVNKA